MPAARQRVGERRGVGAAAERQQLHEQPVVGSLRLAVLHAAFLAESGGSGPRRGFGRLRHALSIIRGSACRLPRPARDARRRRRARAPPHRHVHRHGRADRRRRARRARFARGCAETMPAGHLSRLAGRDRRAARSSPAAASRSSPGRPGPRYAGDRLAFVYNVYTEPAHRRRGLGAADHGGHPRLVPRRRASRRWRSTPAATASRCTSRWAIACRRAR